MALGNAENIVGSIAVGGQYYSAQEDKDYYGTTLTLSFGYIREEMFDSVVSGIMGQVFVGGGSLRLLGSLERDFPVTAGVKLGYSYDDMYSANLLGGLRFSQADGNGPSPIVGVETGPTVLGIFPAPKITFTVSPDGLYSLMAGLGYGW